MSKLMLLAGLLLAFLGCDKSANQEKEAILDKGDGYKIDVQQASGLCLSADGSFLWAVGDQKDNLYKLTFEGETIDKIDVDGNDAEDAEGICVVDDNRLALVLEKSSTLLIVDTLGNIIEQKEFKTTGDPNSGLEGITYNPANGHFFVIKEKDPSLLIELDDEYNKVNSVELKGVKDVSGLHFDAAENLLWIVSDEDQEIYISDTEGNFSKTFKMDVDKAEGIAVDTKNGFIYLVSDSKDKLYRLEYEK